MREGTKFSVGESFLWKLLFFFLTTFHAATSNEVASMHNRFPLRVHSLPVSQPWEDQILFVSTSNNEIETRAGRRFLPWKCIRRPTWGEKTGGGVGKLDYLKFRGNYEGNYRGNLFLDPIVHRGERSTIRSSRKTSATGEIGVLASPLLPVRFFVPRWNPRDGLAPNSFRTTWLRWPLVPYWWLLRYPIRFAAIAPSCPRETFYYLRGCIPRGVVLFAPSLPS